MFDVSRHVWLVRTYKLNFREEKKETSFNSSPKVTWKLWSAPPGSPEFPPASQSKETMCSHCPDRVAWSQDTDRRLRVRVALRTACCLPFSEICCQLQKLKFERSALESTPIIYPGPRRHAAVWSKSSRLALDHPACQKRSKKRQKGKMAWICCIMLHLTWSEYDKEIESISGHFVLFKPFTIRGQLPAKIQHL